MTEPKRRRRTATIAEVEALGRRCNELTSMLMSLVILHEDPSAISNPKAVVENAKKLLLAEHSKGLTG
jgi:hypothetical protein